MNNLLPKNARCDESFISRIRYVCEGSISLNSPALSFKHKFSNERVSYVKSLYRRQLELSKDEVKLAKPYLGEVIQLTSALTTLATLES